MLRFFAFLVGSALLAACAKAPRSRVERPIATVSLQSALVTPSVVRLTCRGGGFCREDVIPSEDTSEIEDVRECCERRRGTVGSAPCPRDGALASCSGGNITVTTYEQDDPKEQAEALENLVSLCEFHGGTLEQRSPKARAD